MNMNSLKFEKLPYLLLQTKKGIYHKFKFSKPARINILFILGCQRSGTTLLTQIFENDLHMKVYGEFSKLSSHDMQKKIRLNSLDLVKKEIASNKVPGVVLKPLVETQNARALLNYFGGSKALWVYRHYKDVAISSIRKFGEKNGINNLRSVINNMPGNWRSEGVSETTRKIVCDLFSENMDPHDAAALFWLVRNRLFFELELDKNPNVVMCRYDDLVSYPAAVIRSIYEHMSCRYPGDKIISEVHSDSIGRGKDIELSPEINAQCKGLLEKLDDIYRSKIFSGIDILLTLNYDHHAAGKSQKEDQ